MAPRLGTCTTEKIIEHTNGAIKIENEGWYTRKNERERADLEEEWKNNTFKVSRLALRQKEKNSSASDPKT